MGTDGEGGELGDRGEVDSGIVREVEMRSWRNWITVGSVVIVLLCWLVIVGIWTVKSWHSCEARVR